MPFLHRSIRTLCVLLAGLFLSVSQLAAADSALDADLKLLQGEWRAELNGDEGTIRMSMKIKDHTMTIAISRPDGEKVGTLSGKFKLQKAGRFRSFTYSDLEALEGPNKGQKLLTGGDTRSSLYRFHDGDFITVSAMDEPDGREPRMIRWTRPSK